MYVSRLLAWPTEKADVECLRDLGIPHRMSFHNYGPAMLQPEQLRSFLVSLQQHSGRRYFTVSELGELFVESTRSGCR